MKPIKIKSLAEADGDYAAAQQLESRLRTAKSKIDLEEADLLSKLTNRPAAPEMTSKVAALLGEATDDSGAVPDGLRTRLREIAAERLDLKAALTIASERLTKARHKASKAICDEVRPDYQIAVQTLADALVSASNAHASLLKIADCLSAGDVAWTGQLAPMQATNIFGENSGRIAAWLREAFSAGFIKSDALPVELRR